MPTTSLDENGAAVQKNERMFFHVQDIIHGHSRPHLVPTVEEAQDPIMRAPVALNVTLFERHEAIAQDIEKPIIFCSSG